MDRPTKKQESIGSFHSLKWLSLQMVVHVHFGCMHTRMLVVYNRSSIRQLALCQLTPVSSKFNSAITCDVERERKRVRKSEWARESEDDYVVSKSWDQPQSEGANERENGNATKDVKCDIKFKVSMRNEMEDVWNLNAMHRNKTERYTHIFSSWNFCMALGEIIRFDLTQYSHLPLKWLGKQ